MNHNNYVFDTSNEYKNTVRSHKLFGDNLNSNDFNNYKNNNGDNIFDKEIKEFQNRLEKLYRDKSGEKFVDELIFSKLDKCKIL